MTDLLHQLSDGGEIDNNCNLVGTAGIVVQLILITLIFLAVKSRRR